MVWTLRSSLSWLACFLLLAIVSFTNSQSIQYSLLFNQKSHGVLISPMTLPDIGAHSSTAFFKRFDSERNIEAVGSRTLLEEPDAVVITPVDHNGELSLYATFGTPCTEESKFDHYFLNRNAKLTDYIAKNDFTNVNEATCRHHTFSSRLEVSYDSTTRVSTNYSAFPSTSETSTTQVAMSKCCRQLTGSLSNKSQACVYKCTSDDEPMTGLKNGGASMEFSWDTYRSNTVGKNAGFAIGPLSLSATGTRCVNLHFDHYILTVQSGGTSYPMYSGSINRYVIYTSTERITLYRGDSGDSISFCYPHGDEVHPFSVSSPSSTSLQCDKKQTCETCLTSSSANVTEPEQFFYYQSRTNPLGTPVCAYSLKSKECVPSIAGSSLSAIGPETQSPLLFSQQNIRGFTADDNVCNYHRYGKKSAGSWSDNFTDSELPFYKSDERWRSDAFGFDTDFSHFAYNDFAYSPFWNLDTANTYSVRPMTVTIPSTEFSNILAFGSASDASNTSYRWNMSSNEIVKLSKNSIQRFVAPTLYQDQYVSVTKNVGPKSAFAGFVNPDPENPETPDPNSTLFSYSNKNLIQFEEGYDIQHHTDPQTDPSWLFLKSTPTFDPSVPSDMSVSAFVSSSTGFAGLAGRVIVPTNSVNVDIPSKLYAVDFVTRRDVVCHAYSDGPQEMRDNVAIRLRRGITTSTTPTAITWTLLQMAPDFYLSNSVFHQLRLDIFDPCRVSACTTNVDTTIINVYVDMKLVLTFEDKSPDRPRYGTAALLSAADQYTAFHSLLVSPISNPITLDRVTEVISPHWGVSSLDFAERTADEHAPVIACAIAFSDLSKYVASTSNDAITLRTRYNEAIPGCSEKYRDSCMSAADFSSFGHFKDTTKPHFTLSTAAYLSKAKQRLSVSHKSQFPNFGSDKHYSLLCLEIQPTKIDQLQVAYPVYFSKTGVAAFIVSLPHALTEVSILFQQSGNGAIPDQVIQEDHIHANFIFSVQALPDAQYDDGTEPINHQPIDYPTSFKHTFYNKSTGNLFRVLIMSRRLRAPPIGTPFDDLQNLTGSVQVIVKPKEAQISSVVFSQEGLTFATIQGNDFQKWERKDTADNLAVYLVFGVTKCDGFAPATSTNFYKMIIQSATSTSIVAIVPDGAGKDLVLCVKSYNKIIADIKPIAKYSYPLPSIRRIVTSSAEKITYPPTSAGTLAVATPDDCPYVATILGTNFGTWKTSRTIKIGPVGKENTCTLLTEQQHRDNHCVNPQYCIQCCVPNGSGSKARVSLDVGGQSALYTLGYAPPSVTSVVDKTNPNVTENTLLYGGQTIIIKGANLGTDATIQNQVLQNTEYVFTEDYLSLACTDDRFANKIFIKLVSDGKSSAICKQPTTHYPHSSSSLECIVPEGSGRNVMLHVCVSQQLAYHLVSYYPPSISESSVDVVEGEPSTFTVSLIGCNFGYLTTDVVSIVEVMDVTKTVPILLLGGSVSKPAGLPACANGSPSKITIPKFSSPLDFVHMRVWLGGDIVSDVVAVTLPPITIVDAAAETKVDPISSQTYYELTVNGTGLGCAPCPESPEPSMVLFCCEDASPQSLVVYFNERPSFECKVTSAIYSSLKCIIPPLDVTSQNSAITKVHVQRKLSPNSIALTHSFSYESHEVTGLGSSVVGSGERLEITGTGFGIYTAGSFTMTDAICKTIGVTVGSDIYGVCIGSYACTTIVSWEPTKIVCLVPPSVSSVNGAVTVAVGRGSLVAKSTTTLAIAAMKIINAVPQTAVFTLAGQNYVTLYGANFGTDPSNIDVRICYDGAALSFECFKRITPTSVSHNMLIFELQYVNANTTTVTKWFYQIVAKSSGAVLARYPETMSANSVVQFNPLKITAATINDSLVSIWSSDQFPRSNEFLAVLKSRSDHLRLCNPLLGRCLVPTIDPSGKREHFRVPSLVIVGPSILITLPTTFTTAYNPLTKEFNAIVVGTDNVTIVLPKTHFESSPRKIFITFLGDGGNYVRTAYDYTGTSFVCTDCPSKTILAISVEYVAQNQISTSLPEPSLKFGLSSTMLALPYDVSIKHTSMSLVTSTLSISTESNVVPLTWPAPLPALEHTYGSDNTVKINLASIPEALRVNISVILIPENPSSKNQVPILIQHDFPTVTSAAISFPRPDFSPEAIRFDVVVFVAGQTLVLVEPITPVEPSAIYSDSTCTQIAPPSYTLKNIGYHAASANLYVDGTGFSSGKFMRDMMDQTSVMSFPFFSKHVNSQLNQAAEYRVSLAAIWSQLRQTSPSTLSELQTIDPISGCTKLNLSKTSLSGVQLGEAYLNTARLFKTLSFSTATLVSSTLTLTLSSIVSLSDIQTIFVVRVNEDDLVAASDSVEVLKRANALLNVSPPATSLYRGKTIISPIYCQGISAIGSEYNCQLPPLASGKYLPFALVNNLPVSLSSSVEAITTPSYSLTVIPTAEAGCTSNDSVFTNCIGNNVIKFSIDVLPSYTCPSTCNIVATLGGIHVPISNENLTNSVLQGETFLLSSGSNMPLVITLDNIITTTSTPILFSTREIKITAVTLPVVSAGFCQAFGSALVDCSPISGADKRQISISVTMPAYPSHIPLVLVGGKPCLNVSVNNTSISCTVPSLKLFTDTSRAGRKQIIEVIFPGSQPVKDSNVFLAFQLCPINHYRPRTPIAGVTVPANSICVACPANTHAPVSGMSSCIPCPAGTVYGSGKCVPCLSNTFNSIEGASSCLPCPVGSVSAIGATSCQTCPLGTFFQSSSSSCVACGTGKVAASRGLSACTDCPLGYVSNDDHSKCVPCPIGTFRDETKTTCVQCDFGFLSTSPGQSKCTKVPAGRFAVSRTVSSSPSPMILSDENLDYNNDDNNNEDSITSFSLLADPTRNLFIGGFASMPCDPGTYAEADGSDSCLPCPVGKSTQVAGGSLSLGSVFGIQKCVECAPGTYQDSTGQSSCISCAPGSYQDAKGMSACLPCEANYYTPSARMINCLPCPVGQQATSTGMTTCQLCPPGTAGSTNGICSDCIAGKFSASFGASQCVDCPVGRFQPTPASSSCQACSAGSYQSVAAQTDCTSCPVGSYAPPPDTVLQNGTVVNGLDQCILADVGTFVPSVGAGAPTPCDPGFAATIPGLDACSQCPIGTFASISADKKRTQIGTEAGADECKSCPVGTFAAVAGQSQCKACEAGKFAAAENLSTCSNCLGGTYQDLTGQSACKICPHGFYSPNSSGPIASCRACEPGKHRNNDNFDNTQPPQCEACPAGYFQPESGQAVCLKCPPGSFSVAGQTLCTPCPVGEYQPNAGSTSCTECIRVTVTVQPAKTGDPPTTKEVSRYAPPPTQAYVNQNALGNSLGATSCIECPIGWYSDANKVSSCIACASGKFSDVEGATICTSCEKGKSSFSQGAGISRCKKCELGRYAAFEGLSSCRPCNPGSSQSGESTSQCTACAAGTYQPQSGGTICPPCEKGKYAATPGSEVCTPCPLGTSQETPGSNECTPCGEGKYADKTGLGACIPCQPGQYSPGQGAQECLACEAGKFAAQSGMKECQACPPGTDQNNPGGSACNKCLPGKYSSGQSAKCDDCPAGTVAPKKGSQKCVACDGSTLDNSGQLIQATHCRCANGFYFPFSTTFLEDVTPADLIHAMIFDDLWSPNEIKIASEVAPVAIVPKADPEEVPASCLPCPMGGLCEYPDGTTFDTMLAGVGYWRSSVTSTEFYRCLNPSHCTPQGCPAYRVGPICAKCAQGAREIATGECVPCVMNNSLNYATTILIGIGIVIACLILCYFIVKSDSNLFLVVRFADEMEIAEDENYEELRMQFARKLRNVNIEGEGQIPMNNSVPDIESEMVEQNNEVEQSSINSVGESAMPLMESESERERKTKRLEYTAIGRPSLTYKIKIMLTFLQIASNMTSLLDMPWPPTFMSVVNIFSIFNLDIVQWSNVNCVTEIDYFLKLVAMGVVPIIFFGLVFLTYYLPYVLRHNDGSPRAEAGKRRRFSKTIKLILFSTFLVYPTVSRIILGMYVCVKVEGVYYLQYDFGVECFSSKWYSYFPFSLLMIAIYPLGIPIASFVALYKHKDVLLQPRTRLKLGFLYDGFSRHAWYFELVDNFHKLLMTSIIAFIPSDAQIQVAMCICIGYLIILLLDSPYFRKGDDKLHLFAQVEIFLIILGSHVFYHSVDGAAGQWDKKNDIIISVFLIVVIVSLGLLFASQVLNVSRKVLAQKLKCKCFETKKDRKRAEEQRVIDEEMKRLDEERLRVLKYAIDNAKKPNGDDDGPTEDLSEAKGNVLHLVDPDVLSVPSNPSDQSETHQFEPSMSSASSPTSPAVNSPFMVSKQSTFISGVDNRKMALLKGSDTGDVLMKRNPLWTQEGGGGEDITSVQIDLEVPQSKGQYSEDSRMASMNSQAMNITRGTEPAFPGLTTSPLHAIPDGSESDTHE